MRPSFHGNKVINVHVQYFKKTCMCNRNNRKARKITGLLYRRFSSANSDNLLQLYLTLVRRHVEYASPVWNPSTCKQIKMLEDVEKFAMRVTTRRWDTGYQDLLNMANVPSLESSMCTLYKIVHGLCYFPPDIVSLRPSPSGSLEPNLPSLTASKRIASPEHQLQCQL